MLTHIEIQNFRCLKSVSVPLRPLTVLIGPNDSGKSAFLDAVNYLAAGSNQTGQSAIGPKDHWRYDPEAKVRISGETSQGRIEVPGLQPITVRTGVLPVQLFHLPSNGVQMASEGQKDAAGAPLINQDGGNVSSLFDYLLRRNRKQFFAAVEALRKLVPGLEDVAIATPDPKTRRLDLIIENGLLIESDRASTGVQILLVFVALAYHPTPPKTILIEEPETGIHPKRLHDVLRLLREITQGKHGGNAAQVILTTHSPYLLDLIDVEKEQVLVFSRQDDGSRMSEPADAERLRLFLDEFMLGEVWFNQGEEGLVARRV